MERKVTKFSGPVTREDRLKAALKANLRRRKAQAAGRVGGPEPGDDAADDAVVENDHGEEKES